MAIYTYYPPYSLPSMPGVLDTLRDLASDEMRERVRCGLVTGNVEGT